MEQIVVLIVAISLASWLYLISFRWSFWRADQRLNTDLPAPDKWPEVVAVIPARDEADSVAAVLSSHASSTYEGKYSIVLVDDHSSDGTSAIAETVADKSPRLIHIAHAPQLEPGWTGKLSALQHGLRIAEKQAPHVRYVLFTDADIVHAPDTLTRLVMKAEHDQIALVSLMARLDSRGLWGTLLIPAFVFFFQKLYPFRAVNDPGSSVAAAAGGCMLVRKDRLVQIGGLSPIRDRLIDDCALAYRIKTVTTSKDIWLGLSRGEVISLRDNRALASTWSMVTRTAFTQLGYSWWKLFGTVAGMCLLYLAAPLAVVTLPWHEDQAMAFLGMVTWLVMSIAYWPTLSLYDKHPLSVCALPVSAGFYALMTIMGALQHLRGQGNVWKGRSYLARTSRY
jgi:hopene-associated glycosyltransferase HpnB